MDCNVFGCVPDSAHLVANVCLNAYSVIASRFGMSLNLFLTKINTKKYVIVGIMPDIPTQKKALATEPKICYIINTNKIATAHKGLTS